MKRSLIITAIILGLFVLSPALIANASEPLSAAKKTEPKCDQGALATYRAYVAARQAVLEAFTTEVSRVKANYALALKTLPRSQRPIARDAFEREKATAVANRKEALAQLGTPPKRPAGCKIASS